MSFDAIVIGSGMSGGMAAKELCERGLKVLVLERGKAIDPAKDYMDHQMPWEFPNNMQVPEDEVARDYPVQSQCYAFSEATRKFWPKDSEQPYSTREDKPFTWIRGDHLGGRSVMWGRQSYRLSEMDFEANAKDGHGTDWRSAMPILPHGTIMSSASSAWPDRRKACRSFPTANSCPRSSSTMPKSSSRRRSSSALPGER